nr:hypothetical protein [Tannerella serpentiformis]
MNLFRIARQALALVLLVAVTERGLAQADTADRYTQTRTIGDGVTVTWIRDNAADHTMARSLFVDTPDSVMARLGLTDGVPATISTFLVETGGRIILFDTGYGFPDSRRAASPRARPVRDRPRLPHPLPPRPHRRTDARRHGSLPPRRGLRLAPGV